MASTRALPPSLLGLDTYLLSRVGKVARGRFADRLAARGLRLWHMAVLAALADFGPHAQRDLGIRLDIHPSDVAKIVDELASAGQVERTRDPVDRRRMSVRITRTGRAALRALDKEARQVREEILAPLSEDERNALSDMLRRLFEHTHPDTGAD
ncbi:MarR family winged helix-turn-helix transcriptional regulator [Nocardia sp. NBC_00565]|uniref:MarR family winged helix-turn-helix transcriptional regulator n=1 Tax=Nocardia sp. NBC_00565 TaxID=2975993 RepID=UPI002E810B57|nr:MarR family winged helix-turn-helix transcriptional regulator [Nocardia sp. NBC_00565]WUC01423.1 MarR family winged helix-turn-helix transcriptional regulator [Nocardia sp. NBC_00565]